MLINLMLLQLSGSVKLGSTILALKGSIVYVTLNMIYEMALSDKSLRTIVTFKLSFPVMRPFMNFKVAIFGELLTTVITSEGFNPKMLSNVYF